MIAPQTGFLPPIHLQNQQIQRNSPYAFYKNGAQQILPQIANYNQNQMNNSSLENINFNSQTIQNQFIKPEQYYQRMNLHFQQNEQNQQNPSFNRNVHNQQNAFHNNYQQNQQESSHNTSFPSMNMSNQTVQFQPNQINQSVQYQPNIPQMSNLQQDSYYNDIQNIDGQSINQVYQNQYSHQQQFLKQNYIQQNKQLYLQRNDQNQYQPYMQQYTGSPPHHYQNQYNLQNTQPLQMQQVHGQAKQYHQVQENNFNQNRGNNYQQYLNDVYYLPNKQIQDNSDYQSQSFQIKNNYGSQIMDRKSQSENQRNNQQLQAMRLIGVYSDSKKQSPQHSENKQELANVLLQQIEEKRKKQLEEKEKNRLHELSLLNYNLKNSPFAKNSRQDKYIQHLREISPPLQQNTTFKLQNIIQPNPELNIPQSVINNNPYLKFDPISQSSQQNIPREFMIDVEGNYQQNNTQIQNHQVQKAVYNQVSPFDQFAQINNKIASIPLVHIAGSDNKINNHLIHMKQNDQTNLDTTNKTLSMGQKNTIMQENNKIVDQMKQREKQINQQKYNGYQEFLQHQIEETKQRKKNEKQRKLEEDTYYEQQFQKQIQEDNLRDILEKQKKQQQYQDISKQNIYSTPVNNKIKHQSPMTPNTQTVITPITQTARAQDIPKQNIQSAQNYKRQSSVHASIMQQDELNMKKSVLSRSQRSYTSDDNKDQKGTFITDKISRIVTQQSQNQQHEQMPKQIIMQIPENNLDSKQYNIEDNQNIKQFQKGMSDMMNQLSENQQRIQQVLLQIKQTNEENTKNTTNQFKEIQRLILNQQTNNHHKQTTNQSQLTTSNIQQISKHNQQNINHSPVQQNPLRTFQRTQGKQKEENFYHKSNKQQTQNKLLQQTPNQVSQIMASNQIIDQVDEKKQRPSLSVDRQNIIQTDKLINKEDMNQLVISQNLSQKDIADSLTDNKKNNDQQQTVIEKQNDISSDSVLQNADNEKDKVNEKSQENSKSVGFKIQENEQEMFNIQSLKQSQSQRDFNQNETKQEENKEQIEIESKSQNSGTSVKQGKDSNNNETKQIEDDQQIDVESQSQNSGTQVKQGKDSNNNESKQIEDDQQIDVESKSQSSESSVREGKDSNDNDTKQKENNEQIEVESKSQDSDDSVKEGNNEGENNNLKKSTEDIKQNEQ